MNQAREIESFVKKAFSAFSISEYGYFYDVDMDTGERLPRKLFFDDTVNEAILDRLVVDLGISKSDILNMNEEPIKAYYNRYPFFALYKRYISELERQSEFADDLTMEEHLLYAMFGDLAEKKTVKRYDAKSITKRVIKQLKEMDEVLPGTFHQGAKINDLAIETECIISYPQVTEMLKSYLQMISDVKALFFKGIKEDLSEEEIKLYNFLSSALRIYDLVAPSVKMNYENLVLYRDVYASEKMTDYFSYVRVKLLVDTSPWRCKEFFDDEELVQQFVNCFPYVKKKLREFVMEVSKFYCRFHWSDAKQVELDEEDEICYEALNMDVNDRPLEWTRVYIPKTDAEMFDWAPYIRKLSKAASPEKKGGVVAPKNEWMIKGILPHTRMMARVMARGGKK